MRTQQHAFLAALRSFRVVHYAVVLVLALTLLVLYYGHALSFSADAWGFMGWFWPVFYFEMVGRIHGALLLVVIFYAAITLGWERSLVVMLVLVAAILPYVVWFSFRSYTTIMSLLVLILPGSIVMSVEAALTSLVRARLAEKEKKKNRAEVLRQTFAAQEDERKRMSQELHDGVIQTLLATASIAHNIQRRVSDEHDNLHADLETIKENSMSMVTEIRCICQDLRPSIIDNLGLVSAVKWLVDEFQQATCCRVEFILNEPVYDPTPEQSLAVFRIVQEALNNVRKHAQAASIWVEMRLSAGTVVVEVRDDGKGFSFDENNDWFAISGKLGMMTMKERAQSIGGRLQIKSVPGFGTSIRFSLGAQEQGQSWDRLPGSAPERLRSSLPVS
jgi:two-component system sensor histidine kinase DegS